MLVISDTNILSSLAAGGEFDLLSRLFPGVVIYIPPAVDQELQIGFARGKTYLEVVLEAIEADELQVLDLSDKEQQLAQSLPQKLNDGECEAIALAQHRKARLLSNDKRAVRYCQNNGIKVVNLPNLLRLLWTRRILSKNEVRNLLDNMKAVENLTLSQKARDEIFAPPPSPRRKRRRGKRRR